MSRPGRQRAFSLIGETCPDVERIVHNMGIDIEGRVEAAVKTFTEQAILDLKAQVTEPFRDALIDACSDLETAEEERNALQDKVDDLEDEVRNLKREIEDLEQQLRDAQA